MSTSKKILNNKMMVMTLLSVSLGNFLIIFVSKTLLLVDNKLFTTTNNNNSSSSSSSSKITIWYLILVEVKDYMYIISNNDTKSPELQASIIEPILLSCMDGISFNLLLLIMRKILQIYSFKLKRYLFYLIDYGVISYDGLKQAYKIENGGLGLLEMIKKEKIREKADINEITITFEYH
jgi:hypothetical protein